MGEYCWLTPFGCSLTLKLWLPWTPKKWNWFGRSTWLHFRSWSAEFLFFQIETLVIAAWSSLTLISSLSFCSIDFVPSISGRWSFIVLSNYEVIWPKGERAGNCVFSLLMSLIGVALSSFLGSLSWFISATLILLSCFSCDSSTNWIESTTPSIGLS